jgi:hypothetical protein
LICWEISNPIFSSCAEGALGLFFPKHREQIVRSDSLTNRPAVARWSDEVRVNSVKCGEQKLSKNLQRQSHPDEDGYFFAVLPGVFERKTHNENETVRSAA